MTRYEQNSEVRKEHKEIIDKGKGTYEILTQNVERRNERKK